VNSIDKLIEATIMDLIGGEDGLKLKVDELLDKHVNKIHFVPIKYRVLGGFLQSLNIKFGNFIEMLLDKIISNTPTFEIYEVSGKKGIVLELEERCERAIDEYVSTPSHNRLETLYEEIFTYQNEGEKFRKKSLDINVMFKFGNTSYYLETKYNDDHDTGKFQDINRKFLKTYAGLVRYYRFDDKNKFRPILYYFLPTIRYNPNPYLREGIEIFRGKKLFEEFELSTSYEEVVNTLNELEKILDKKFDEFRDKIFEMVSANVDKQKK
jgi:hypothetical protein